MPTNKRSKINPSLLSENNVKKYVLPKYNLSKANIEQVKFKDTDKQRAVYRVESTDNLYCLKKVYFPPSTLLFVYSTIEWWHRHGINVPKLLPTIDNGRFTTYNSGVFILTSWIKGEKCDYNNKEHIYKTAMTLGKMHSSGKNFTPIYGSNSISKFDNLYCSLEKHHRNLDSFYDLSFKFKDDFSKLYIKNFELMNSMADISVKSARGMDMSKLSKSLCHGDFVNKNIIFNSKGDTCVIDFDKSSIDYISHDIGYALRRILRRDSTAWDLELTLTYLNIYNQVNPLNVDDYRYLLSYLAFPQKYWKISRDYFNYRDKCNKAAFINILQKNLRLTEKHYNFTINFKNYIEDKFNIQIT